MLEIMSGKICTKCGESKLESEFGVNSARINGLSNFCKKCTNTNRINYRRTKSGLIVKMYSAQLGSCRKRKHDPPSYSISEFKEWILGNKKFHKIYDEWVVSGYLKELIPSVDRSDNYLSYSFDNIKIGTWRQNIESAAVDRVSGINNKGNRAVVQFNVDGSICNRFHSTMNAFRSTKIDKKSIHSVCSGKRNTAGGFLWRFEDELK